MAQVSLDLIAQLYHDKLVTTTNYKGPIQVLKKVGGALADSRHCSYVLPGLCSISDLLGYVTACSLTTGGKNTCLWETMREAIELVCVGADEVPKTPVNGRYFRKFLPDSLLEEIKANYRVSYRASF